MIFEGNDAVLGTYSKQLDCDGSKGTAIILYPNKNMKRRVINLSGASNENPEQIMTSVLTC